MATLYGKQGSRTFTLPIVDMEHTVPRMIEREGAGSLVLGKKRKRRKKQQHMQRKKLLFHRTLFQFSLFGV